MPIYEISTDSLNPLQRTDFASEGLRERADLQRLIRDQIEVLDPDLLVIGEEFGDWDESRRRIDLLAVDREANLVVIELKRTETGGHMELQALRYAAMVSAMTFDRAVGIYRAHIQGIGGDDDPESNLLEFLEWSEPDEEHFAQDVRVVLASADFSKELTTTVIWLNERGLDIRCFRFQLYSDGDRVLLDVQQVIPLPEAEEYQIQLREKVRRERRTGKGNRDTTRYDVSVSGNMYPNLSKRNAGFRVVQSLVALEHAPEEISAAVDEGFFERKFRGGAQGHLNERAFVEAMSLIRRGQGKTFNPGRWYTQDDELIHYDGQTYAFSKGWGGQKWLTAMNALTKGFSSADIRFDPTGSRIRHHFVEVGTGLKPTSTFFVPALVSREPFGIRR